MPCQKIQIQKKYYWWVFKEIMNQRLSEESKCDYKKAIIEFCRFMNIDTPLVEVMVDKFLQEVFQINKKRFTNIGGIEESVHLIFDNENLKVIEKTFLQVAKNKEVPNSINNIAHELVEKYPNENITDLMRIFPREYPFYKSESSLLFGVLKVIKNV